MFIYTARNPNPNLFEKCAPRGSSQERCLAFIDHRLLICRTGYFTGKAD